MTPEDIGHLVTRLGETLPEYLADDAVTANRDGIHEYDLGSNHHDQSWVCVGSVAN